MKEIVPISNRPIRSS